MAQPKRTTKKQSKRAKRQIVKSSMRGKRNGHLGDVPEREDELPTTANTDFTKAQTMLSDERIPLTERQTMISQAGEAQGNRSVQRLMSAGQRKPESGAKKIKDGPISGLSVIQRENGQDEAADVATPEDITLDISSVYLRALPEYRIQITNPAGMNESAVRLMERLQTAGEQSSNLRDELGYLQYAGETGSDSLGAIQDIQGELGRLARGREGEYLRTAVERYTNANIMISAKLSNVKSKQEAVAAAAARLHAVILDGKITEAAREEEAATTDVAAVKARIARAKTLAKGLINPASNLLQGKWKEAGIDLAKFVGQEIVTAAVDAAYSSELREAQERLKEAKAAVDKFEDEHQLERLEAATSDLQSSNSASDAAQDELMAVVWQAEEAHATLTEELEGMGNPDAAAALDARSATMEASARTLKLLDDYEKLIKTINRHSKALKGLNVALSDLMISAGGPVFVPNETHRLYMWEAADLNAAELEQVETFADNEQSVIGSARGFVEGGSYLEAYNQIDTALHEGIINR